ncbi:formate dehydrogenase subunit gamma [Sedimentitalea sp. XS_ASV28]|uniref:formate dehydrogenase subunit gamma n=1 Tax=Sedimentitalea sp. XS_ASV28 TaxID=3241296 RepID=UPI0035184464
MQPAASPFSDEDLRALASAHAGREGPLLPLLHDIQDRFGHIPETAHEIICDALNISRAELHGVISFYHDFRQAPAGRHVLKVCRAESCQSVGANAVAEAVLARLGLEWHGTTNNGAVTIEPVYCLGLCACAPAAMMDDRVIGRVDAAKLDRILAEAGA